MHVALGFEQIGDGVHPLRAFSETGAAVLLEGAFGGREFRLEFRRREAAELPQRLAARWINGRDHAPCLIQNATVRHARASAAWRPQRVRILHVERAQRRGDRSANAGHAFLER